MKSIKHRGQEAVLVSELVTGDYIFLTFLKKHDFGVSIIRVDYDGVFGILTKKEMSISEGELNAIQAFRTNQINTEEFAERIQLAQ